MAPQKSSEKERKTEAICHSFALLKNSQKMLEIGVTLNRVFNGAKAQAVLNQEYGAVLSFRTAVWAWLCQAKCFHFFMAGDLTKRRVKVFLPQSAIYDK